MLRNLLSAIALLIVSAVSAQPYMTTSGGTYQRVTDKSQVKDNDIVILASRYKNATSDSVITIMSTVKVKNQYFGAFVTDMVYTGAMPSTITLLEVNKDTLAYEYAVKYQSTQKDADYIYLSLRDINKQYVYVKTAGETATGLNKTAYYWRLGNITDGVQVRENKHLYQIQTSTDKDGYNRFRNATQASEPIAQVYRKVYPLTIGSTGYATFYYGNNDVVLPAGLKAYVYEFKGDKLAPSSTVYDGDNGDVVPHATAVIVKGTAGTTYTLDVKNAQTTSVEGALRGSDAASSTQLDSDAAGSRYYVFAKGDNGLGFYWAAGDGAAFTNGAHKAYLCVSNAAAAKGIKLILPDMETSVDIVEVSQSCPSSDAWYDLSGRKVKPQSKGIYIHNGKKIVY